MHVIHSRGEKPALLCIAASPVSFISFIAVENHILLPTIFAFIVNRVLLERSTDDGVRQPRPSASCEANSAKRGSERRCRLRRISILTMDCRDYLLPRRYDKLNRAILDRAMRLLSYGSGAARPTNSAARDYAQAPNYAESHVAVPMRVT